MTPWPDFLAAHAGNFPEAMILGKGPSADNLPADYPHPIMALGDSALLAPHVEYLMTDHPLILLRARAAWPRVSWFLLPDQMTRGPQGRLLPHEEVEGLPLDRVVLWQWGLKYQDHGKLDKIPERVAECLADGQLRLTTTAVQGLLALVLLGYRRVWVLGCDGGRGNVAGVVPSADHNYDRKREAIRRAAHAVRDRCEVRFWPEGF